jgi:tetratricopeptide (TPR) repeat protein
LRAFLGYRENVLPVFLTTSIHFDKKMAKRKVAQEEASEQVYTPATGSSLSFFEKNQNLILYVVGGILAIALLWFGYKKFVAEPKQKEAVEAMWMAQAAFERDSFQQALENPGTDGQGFLSIIDNYGGTPAGNLAQYYAGVCYLQRGDFDKAIEHLENFDADGDFMPILKAGLLGDAYSEKNDFDKAMGLYEDASNAGKNSILAAYYLKKYGLLCDKQGKKEEAVKAFQRLRADFPSQNSADWRDAEKYIYKNGAGE